MVTRVDRAITAFPTTTTTTKLGTERPAVENVPATSSGTYVPQSTRTGPTNNEQQQYFEAVAIMRNKLLAAGGRLAAEGVDLAQKLHMAVEGNRVIVQTPPKLQTVDGKTTATFGALVNPEIGLQVSGSSGLVSIGLGASAAGVKGYQVTTQLDGQGSSAQKAQANDLSDNFRPPLALTGAQQLPANTNVTLYVKGSAMTQGSVGSGALGSGAQVGAFATGSSMSALSIQTRPDGKVSVKVHDQSSDALGGFLSANALWTNLNQQITDAVDGRDVSGSTKNAFEKLTDALTVGATALHASGSGASGMREYIFDPKSAAAHNAYGGLINDPNWKMDDANLPAGVTRGTGFDETSEGQIDRLDVRLGPAGEIIEKEDANKFVTGTTLEGQPYARVETSMVSNNMLTKPWVGLGSGTVNFSSVGHKEGIADTMELTQVVKRDDDTTAADASSVARLAEVLGAHQTAASLKDSGLLTEVDRSGQNKREIRLTLSPAGFGKLGQLSDTELDAKLQTASQSPAMKLLGVTSDDVETYKDLVATLNKATTPEARARVVEAAADGISPAFFALTAAVVGQDAVAVNLLRLETNEEKYKTFDYTSQ